MKNNSDYYTPIRIQVQSNFTIFKSYDVWLYFQGHEIEGNKYKQRMSIAFLLFHYKHGVRDSNVPDIKVQRTFQKLT